MMDNVHNCDSHKKPECYTLITDRVTKKKRNMLPVLPSKSQSWRPCYVKLL
jgi:hypothetical protein